MAANAKPIRNRLSDQVTMVDPARPEVRITIGQQDYETVESTFDAVITSLQKNDRVDHAEIRAIFVAYDRGKMGSTVEDILDYLRHHYRIQYSNALKRKLEN